ncbi:uncharacterized protein TNCV_2688771 [Trichonephila clavipes]|nr:uncharacterized protein TNCV_2688771 [Trichonephila clavipes]
MDDGFPYKAGRHAVLLPRWIVRSVPLEIVGGQWTPEGAHARKTGSGATRMTLRGEDRRIVRQAPLDPTVTRSTIRADVGVAIVPQFPDTLQKQILNPGALSVHSL